jgi:V/A-type H+-transporting ATPase subunit I
MTVHALELLARTGSVELDVYPKTNASLEVRALLDTIQTFDQLAEAYRDYLPEHERRPSALNETPDQTMRRATDLLKRWIADLDPSLEHLHGLQAERGSLMLLREYVTTSGQTHPDLALLSRPESFLHKGLYACPQEQSLDGTLVHVFKKELAGARHRFLILIGLHDQAPEIERAVREGACLRVEVPAWLAQQSVDWPGQIHARLAVIDNDIVAAQRAIDAIRNDPALRETLADFALLKWYAQQAAALSTDEPYCRITGWTSYKDPAQLQTVLNQRGIEGFVRFLIDPVTRPAPVKTTDAWWARPFQPFIHMYGVPEAGEVDPSPVLVFVVPLLFGYMFPDVGHGLLLILLSATLYQRWPEGRLLIPCGLAAILFGFVFGDVFGFHDVIRPLWIKPLDAPMTVLMAPLFLGAGLIALGMVFAGIQFFWRDELRNWLLGDAALLVLYLGILTAVFQPLGLYIAAGALAWFVVGSLILHQINPAYRIGGALGRLLENIFQLTLNTISFLRVGIFSLAHAAISSAVLLVAESMPNRASYWIVFILSQLLAVMLEALVVFVQTTRLVFFEFFIRFLRAEGRIFKPLHPPRDLPQTRSK